VGTAVPPQPAAGAAVRVAPAARGHATPAHVGSSQPAHARARTLRRPRPRRARALRRAKAAAQRRYRRHNRGLQRTPRPLVRQRPSVFGPLNWEGVAANAATPPDTTGAIGLAHYIEATNDGVEVYDRADHAPVDSTTLDDFLGVPGHEVADPQILWDSGSGRWYFAGLDVESSSQQLLLGWSRTSDPSDLSATGWCRFMIPTPGVDDDFPKLGDYDGGIVIGANRFDGTAFKTAVIYAIDKPGAGTTCTMPPFTRFGSSASPLKQSDGQLIFTPVPANTTDASNTGQVVAAASPEGSSANRVEVWHVGGQPGTPTLTRDGAVAVSSYAVPANAPQLGSTSVLDTSDARLTQAVARTDPAVGVEAVWTQHTVAGPAGRSIVRWYELVPSQLAARQTGSVSEAAEFAFNGAISPTGDGSNAVIDYNASSASTFPRIAVRARRAAAKPGALSSAVTLVTSAGPLEDGSCSPCRWGDYASAVPDPLDSTLVWGSNEYVAADGAWTSRNFAIAVGGDPPVARFGALPAGADTGQLVAFDASSSTAAAGASLVRYEWDLDGNGSFETDTGANPHASRSYPTARTVTVRLRVTDTVGDQGEAERPLTVRDRPPVAALTVSQNRVGVRKVVLLDGSASFDPDGQVTRYQWDLDGNGTFETDTARRSVTESTPFPAPRVVTVRLRVTDDSGSTADASARLTVFRPAPSRPTRACRAARARKKRLVASVRKLRRQVKHARGARKRRLARKLRTTRAALSRTSVRVRTIC
jgi:YD repeat-containing protein